MTTDLHVTAESRLRRVGQRYTTNRRLLVGLLADAGQPLAIPDVLDRRDDLAQSSVYRNLAVLEQAGVVRRILASDEFSRYELAEDLTEHHHHLICSNCGGVEDFTAPTLLERTVEQAIDHVAGSSGFTAEHHRLDLIGTCRSCA